MDSNRALFMNMLRDQQRVINSLCSVYYPAAEDMKDARQDVILQLWKAWSSFRNESQTSTWVYRIGLNTLLNKKRQESKQPLASSFNNIDELTLQATAQFDDDLELLKQIIGWLGNLEKAIVVLHLEGYKHKEIADMLNLSPSNVGTRMNRIKLKLKNYHQQNSHEPQ